MSLLDLYRSNLDRAKRDEVKYQGQLNDLNVKIAKATTDIYKAKTPSKLRSLQSQIKRDNSKSKRVTRSHQLASGRVRSYSKKIATLEKRQFRDISERLTDVERQSLDQLRVELSENYVERRFDVFLCHDDRDAQPATDLYNQMTDLGLAVWFDDKVANRGLSLANQIDEGLTNSHIGVILLTPQFFEGGYWRQAERGALLTSRKRVYPVRHGMTYDDLLSKSVLLADRIGESVNEDRDFGFIAQEIAEIVEEVKAEMMGEREQDNELIG